MNWFAILQLIVVACVACMIIFTFQVGWDAIASGYGAGKPDKLSTGLLCLLLAIGGFVHLGMVLFHWFEPVAR